MERLMGSDHNEAPMDDKDLLQAALRVLLGASGAQAAGPATNGAAPQTPYASNGWQPANGTGSWQAANGNGSSAGWADPPRQAPPAAPQPTSTMQQALIWLAIGAAIAYILSDREIRDKLLRQMMKLYSDVVVGFEEMKATVSDMKAEVDAGHASSNSSAS
ncbi:YtxH domain-containing protein [Synechococcus sp. RSCCF101]|uniref:YtxH domain-containing protein n=1 Tax=Synechococcus sp. RSCCF101 TaxID=2511069 RepID=UPI0012A15C3F|nr:YtxH domain-containing protein [Synechococcus sp. RSCCF101]QEY31431.1 YtxH domain-containing protein [Synechococcus sp. RSCCF101]